MTRRAVILLVAWWSGCGEPPPAPPLPDPGSARLDEAAVVRLLAEGVNPNASVSGRNPSGEVGQTTALCAAAANRRLQGMRAARDRAHLSGSVGAYVRRTRHR